MWHDYFVVCNVFYLDFLLEISSPVVNLFVKEIGPDASFLHCLYLWIRLNSGEGRYLKLMLVSHRFTVLMGLCKILCIQRISSVRYWSIFILQVWLLLIFSHPSCRRAGCRWSWILSIFGREYSPFPQAGTVFLQIHRTCSLYLRFIFLKLHEFHYP